MKIIKITDSGQVLIPATIEMRDFEIAELLGAMVPTVRGAIQRLLKSRMVIDCGGGIVSGSSIVPEYFGMEVVIAVAFQVESYQADTFRKWIMRKSTQVNAQPIYIGINDIRDNIYN